MEAMNLTTPALLFPAISLLLLAYTNRFLVLAQVIRQLHGSQSGKPSERVLRQIRSLRHRVSLIQHMQSLGVLSFLLCALSMFALFLGYQKTGEVLFGLSTLALTLSLIFSLLEVLKSTQALSIALEDMEQHAGQSAAEPHNDPPHSF